MYRNELPELEILCRRKRRCGRRKDGLVIEELPDEVLVYDLKRDKAHCLNPIAALVWRHRDGETSMAEMIEVLSAELKTPVDEKLVWCALDQLEKSHLLQERLTPPVESRLSRQGIGSTIRFDGWVRIAVNHIDPRPDRIGGGKLCSHGRILSKC